MHLFSLLQMLIGLLCKQYSNLLFGIMLQNSNPHYFENETLKSEMPQRKEVILDLYIILFVS